MNPDDEDWRRYLTLMSDGISAPGDTPAPARRGAKRSGTKTRSA